MKFQLRNSSRFCLKKKINILNLLDPVLKKLASLFFMLHTWLSIYSVLKEMKNRSRKKLTLYKATWLTFKKLRRFCRILCVKEKSFVEHIWLFFGTDISRL